jgi:ribonuclease HII
MKKLICGIDEAGRGPLAGPVAAAAVILSDGFPRGILDDSKKLSEKKRDAAEKIILERALWGIAFADHDEIDSLNILQASLLAMSRAFSALCDNARRRALVLDGVTLIVDGNKIPPIHDARVCEITALVKADASVYHVMAASILAKCARDRIMRAFAKMYPAYGYHKHKGYATREHRALCRELGPSPIQRKTFSY